MSHRTRSLLLALGFAGLAGPLAAAEQNGFQLSVLVDGAPPESTRPATASTSRPSRAGSSSSASPTRPERVAVALSVDGRNVIDAQAHQRARRGQVDPGARARRSTSRAGRSRAPTARRFFFTETSKSYAKWLGDTANVGTIEAVFFREKRRPPVVMRQGRRRGRADARGGRLPGASSRRLPPPPPRHEQGRGRRRASPRPASARRPSFPVQWAAFEEDQRAGGSHRAPLRVPRPSSSDSACCRARDDLYARDRAQWLRARLRTRSVPALKPPARIRRRIEAQPPSAARSRL